jgi:ubiquitin-protein ligase
MLNDPNIESPANLDASNEFKSARDLFNRKVRVLAAKSVDYL